jgi:hypothetical protein
LSDSGEKEAGAFFSGKKRERGEKKEGRKMKTLGGLVFFLLQPQ